MVQLNLFGVACVLAGLVFQTADLKTMTKMTVRLTGPGIRHGSSAQGLKVIYRAGKKYARMEDARQKITIIAEPDAYSIDVPSKVGTHAIDQGGPNDLHLPIVLPFDPNHKLPELDRLEFGEELDFFKKAGAKKTKGPGMNGQPTDLYSLDQAELVIREGSDKALSVSWTTHDGTYKYTYLTYEDVPFNLQLFAPPAGVRIREVPPVGPDEQK